MEVKEALFKRRSVRKFSDEPVSEEMISELLHAAMSGPSACNKTPWEFYIITDEEVLKKLRRAARYSKLYAEIFQKRFLFSFRLSGFRIAAPQRKIFFFARSISVLVLSGAEFIP